MWPLSLPSCSRPPRLLAEAGTFDVVTANTVNMWTSASFSVINKGAADSLTVTWTLTFP